MSLAECEHQLARGMIVLPTGLHREMILLFDWPCRPPYAAYITRIRVPAGRRDTESREIWS